MEMEMEVQVKEMQCCADASKAIKIVLMISDMHIVHMLSDSSRSVIAQRIIISVYYAIVHIRERRGN